MNTRRRFGGRTMVVALTALLLFVTSAWAGPGDLDTSFSGDGKVTTSFSTSVDQANAVAIQADGKIVVVGMFDFEQGFAIARYNADGSPDTSFGGGDGQVTTREFGNGGFPGDYDFALTEAFDVAIQPDQKIVVAGSSVDNRRDPGTGEGDFSYDFAIARYNTNGNLDTSFSGDGAVDTKFAAFGQDGQTTNDDQAQAVAVQSDGDIVAAGYADPVIGGNENDFAAARYNSNGTLDSGFGGDGKVTMDVLPTGSNDTGYDLALVPGNKVLVAGGSTSTVGNGRGSALAQFNSDGTPDTTFDSNGTRVRNFTGVDELHSVTRQADGKIVAGGLIGDDFALLRFNADGSNDNSFDANGYIITNFNGASGQVWNDVKIASDGKILTAGTSQDYASSMVAGRFFSNGAIDRNFAPCFGAQRTDFGGAYYGATGQGLAIDSSGRLVVAGSNENDWGIARYQTGSTVADCKPPNTTITGPARTRSRRPSFRLHATEAGSRFQCKVGGVGEKFAACTSPYKVRRLKRGFRSIEVRAIDKAGNIDASPSVKKFRILKPRRR